MSYTQRFGLSRKSPFNNVDETDKKDTAKQQAVSKTPSNDVFGELEYKTQSERGMSDSEYRDQYEMGNIHNPALDGVIMRSGVDYDAFYKKHGEDADFEEHMKKNLGDDLYKRSLAENFTKDPYYKDIMRRGLEGRSDYSSFSKIMPSGEVDVSKVADNVQEGLDYAGMLFPPADLVNMGISGIRAGGSLLSGDMQGFKKHSKRGVKSAVSTVPIFGDTFAAGTKLAKLNKFGKSKGTIYKPGMFKPESTQKLRVTMYLVN